MAKEDKTTPNEPQDDEGASPQEQLFEACRRDNVDLLNEILESITGTTDLPTFLNESRNALGEMALHVAVKCGSYEILDALLDQEGLEVDPISRMDEETPLHFAARYTGTDAEVGSHMVELLVEAGADPRLKSRGKQKPVDLVDPRCEKVRESLNEAEVASGVQAGIQREAAQFKGEAFDDDEAGSGPASDSE
ncbi:hypothetical protein H072_6617 [Dactylellina haptotyla CBS 200.50]|uniref:Uncharacterized protein n=1 Tax=Dactylellina haptotyla (strain CBS 200.50) TaxID=1284197 RepID=S8BWA7_DACHA|nr:hypothetical protein H072_6617 [Dactylellina haptotyla CBS 200.50]